MPKPDDNDASQRDEAEEVVGEALPNTGVVLGDSRHEREFGGGGGQRKAMTVKHCVCDPHAAGRAGLLSISVHRRENFDL